MTLPDVFDGKWLVLFSHPADFTPVCRTEFVAFAKRYNQFKDLNSELIGLSVDQVTSHLKWTVWIQQNIHVEIPFPIIADTGNVASMPGMVHPGKAPNTVPRSVHRGPEKHRSTDHLLSSGGRQEYGRDTKSP